MDHIIVSTEREAGTDTDFSIQLNIPAGHTHMSLKMIGLPRSYYNVVSGKNSFLLGSTVYSVAPGFYQISDLVNVLNAMIAPSTVQWNRVAGRLTFLSTQPTLSFPSSSRLYRLMGFNANSTNSFVANTLISTNVVNTTAIDQGYLLCDAVYDESQSSFGNVLESFAVNITSDLSMVVYNNLNIKNGKRLVAGGASAAIKIPVWFKLVNEDGDTLDLQGHPLTFVVHTYTQDEIAAKTYQLLKGVTEMWASYVDEIRSEPVRPTSQGT